MVGYPAFTQSGIIVATLFVPTLKRGGQITVQSDLAPACGTWWINNLTYDLESMVPGGKWFAVIEAGRIKVQDTP